MLKAGLKVDEIRVIGGHSSIDSLNDLKYKSFDIPFKLYPPGSDLIGNAVLGFVVNGDYSSLDEACQKMVRKERCFNI